MNELDKLLSHGSFSLFDGLLNLCQREFVGFQQLGSESYIAHRDPAWFQIRVRCHCLEQPKAGVPREDDYLRLEVWLKCVPGRWSSFEVFRNTDSSSL